MADYREIKGLKVPYLDSDLPSASASTQEGSVWYNSVTGKLRAFIASDTWATSSDMGTARYDGAAAGITQSTGLAIAGSAPDDSALVELYNGSGWTEVGDINTARNALGGNHIGTSTSAMCVAGHTSTNVAIAESYDGSSWTEVGDINTARRSHGGLGQSNTTGVIYGGYTTTYVAICESYNGSAWTETGNLNTGGTSRAGAGTQTAGMAIAGYAHPAVTANVENFDGSSWTEQANVNTARQNIGAAGGPAAQTSALAFGGSVSPQAQTES